MLVNNNLHDLKFGQKIFKSKKFSVVGHNYWLEAWIPMGSGT